MVMQWTVNPPPSGTTGSIPVFSTKIWLHSIMVSTVACHAINRGSIPLGAANFTLVVKWYNGGLISLYYKFNSCRGYQFQDANSKFKFHFYWKKKMHPVLLLGCRIVANTTGFELVYLGSIPSTSASLYCVRLLGQVNRLSTYLGGFDSRTQYQYAVVVLWEGNGLSIRLRRVRFSSTAPEQIEILWVHPCSLNVCQFQWVIQKLTLFNLNGE